MKRKTVFLVLLGLGLSAALLPPVYGQKVKHRLIELKPGNSGGSLRSETLPASSKGQAVLTSELNLPRPDDFLVKQQLPYVQPGDSGANKVWNFSRVTAEGNDYAVNYFQRPGSLLVGGENATLHAYSTEKNAWLSSGYESPTTLVRYEKPEVVMPFPFGYGMRSGDYYYGKGKYCDRLEMSVAGAKYSEADGYGTLVLPGGDTIRHALRIHHIKQVTEHYQPLAPGFDLSLKSEARLSADSVVSLLEQDSIIRMYDIYQWYAEGYRYPVFETTSIYRDVEGKTTPEVQYSCLFHPVDQGTLPEDLANQAIQEKNRIVQAEPTAIAAIAKTTSRIYPNPVENELHVSLELQTPAQVQIFLYDLQGRLLYQSSPAQGERQYSESVDMSRMQKGNYLVRVQVGNESVRKMIVKQ